MSSEVLLAHARQHVDAGDVDDARAFLRGDHDLGSMTYAWDKYSVDELRAAITAVIYRQWPDINVNRR